MPQSRKIIIDTDPGQDDAVAILLALGSSELEIVGITAVAGNVPLKLTQNNARKICELAGRPDVKVYAGAIRPLARALVSELADARIGESAAGRREVVRDVTKRVRRLIPFTSFVSLDEEQMRTRLHDVISEALIALADGQA